MFNRRRLGFWMYRSHAWAGLIGGLFLLFICATGAIAVFKPEIESAVDWQTPSVADRGPPTVSPDAAARAAASAFPDLRVAAVHLPVAEGIAHGNAYRVDLAAPKSATRSALVDPYAGTVLASIEGKPYWANVVRQMHVRFYYGGDVGRWIVGGFGLVLTFAVVSGAWIYLRFNAGRWRPTLRRGRGARVLLADVHKLVGIASLAFHLMFGVTGVVLGLEPLYKKLVADGRAPAVRRAAVATLPDDALARAIGLARDLIPDGRPTSVALANATAGTLKVLVDLPAASLVREGESGVTFDAATLEPIAVVDARQAGAAARLYYAVEPIHLGRLGGSPVVKLIWSAMGMSAAFLAISGFAIYALRSRKRKPAPKATT